MRILAINGLISYPAKNKKQGKIGTVASQYTIISNEFSQYFGKMAFNKSQLMVH